MLLRRTARRRNRLTRDEARRPIELGIEHRAAVNHKVPALTRFYFSGALERP
jgi:hypothetical protein